MHRRGKIAMENKRGVNVEWDQGRACGGMNTGIMWTGMAGVCL